RVHAAKPGAPSKPTFLVADSCHPQNIELVRTRASGPGLEVKVGDWRTFEPGPDTVGILLQYPATDGSVPDYAECIRRARAAGALVRMATGLLALTLVRSPGELGADIAVGSAQRFGVPLGFGGPHAAFIAARDAHKRSLPGRLVGVSRDARGRPA